MLCIKSSSLLETSYYILIMLAGQIFYYHLLGDKNNGQMMSNKVQVETYYQFCTF